MFCPKCRAKYRAGFTTCADCQTALVEILAPENLNDPELDVYERPDQAPSRFFLAWFLPMSAYFGIVAAVAFRPSVMKNLYVEILVFLFYLAGNLGAFWMMYQAVRYEKNVAKYVLLSFVPFMFIWYSLVRAPLHDDFVRQSQFIR